MQTPIDLSFGKPPPCEICGATDAKILVYCPETKRKIGVCEACAADDRQLEKIKKRKK